MTRSVSAGSHFSWTVVSAGSRRSRTVSAEAKYDGQSLQEAKLSGLVYTLCFIINKYELSNTVTFKIHVQNVVSNIESLEN